MVPIKQRTLLRPGNGHTLFSRAVLRRPVRFGLVHDSSDDTQLAIVSKAAWQSATVQYGRLLIQSAGSVARVVCLTPITLLCGRSIESEPRKLTLVGLERVGLAIVRLPWFARSDHQCVHRNDRHQWLVRLLTLLRS